jgi:hypothetical protein
MATDLVDTFIARMIAWLRRVAGIFASKVWRRKMPMAAATSEKGQDELVRELSEKHPDWKPGILRYLVREDRRHRKAQKRD